MADLQASEAAWTELDPLTAYAIMRLRVDVFVVEQACPYPELDGRDLEPGTRHLWLHAADAPTDVRAYLRLLDDGDVLRIGRVVTAPAARGGGAAARLMTSVVRARGAGSDLVLDAQSHLVDWYARFGFTADGEGFVEDGIPHTPMRRRAG